MTVFKLLKSPCGSILSFLFYIHPFSKESSPVPASAGSQTKSKDCLHEMTVSLLSVMG